MKAYRFIITAIVIGFFFVSCSENNEQYKSVVENSNGIGELTIQKIKVPTTAESSVSNLFVGKNGEVYLTWTETKESENSSLYFSTLEENKWSSPTKILEGNNWVVNWADFPSLTQFGENSLVINFLEMTDEATFAYDVKLAISNDGGKTWGESFAPHKDNTKTEHGFVSLVKYGENQFMAIWLDGRKYDSEEEPDEMTLRSAIINQDGSIDQEFVIDTRVCDCCATSAVTTSNGVSVVYRDRSDAEIRDIYASTFNNGNWSEPIRISRDGWEINGCPVNGPAIESYENNTAVAWFTAANDNAKVNVAFSVESNKFTTPVAVNTTRTLGRVDVTYINKDKVAICWMEEENDIFYIKVRMVNSDGSGIMEEPIVVSKTEGSRSSGFPKMVKSDSYLVFSWTETGETSVVKTAKIKL
ncbi:MAG: hypothetical protein JKY53_10205 [Flavobacteriales bacterium]|nr:hypothetical protein [Flavobacteriales bacterium]